MKPPAFWYQPPGMLSTLLAPLGMLYNAVAQRRALVAKPLRGGIPVVCVGNLTLGGAGKTPVIGALVQALEAKGLSSHIVSRGYGGTLKGPLRVDPNHHTAQEVGDEPLLHAAMAPTWVSKDRAEGVVMAQQGAPSVVLMDDGFQNSSVHKDFSLLVMDGPTGLGNGKVFPAGPLREGAHQGLTRADAVLVLDSPSPEVRHLLASIKVPIFYGHRRMTLPPLDERPIIAFTGIALPDRFFRNIPAVKTVAFPDHHPFSEKDLRSLVPRQGERLWTTAKDYVRLPASFRSLVEVVGLTIDLPPALVDFLGDHLERLK